MSTFLFDDIVFGPIRSRRLGISLGINLLPKDYKLCTFDCIYCECEFSEKGKSGKIPTVTEYKDSLQKKLEELKSEGITPDVFTFAGNGEPTIHPDFPEIVDFTILKRDEFFPNAKISVLSNSTMLHKQPVVDALKRVDNNILKLDSAIDETVKLMDAPN
jgi:wyosine [tRNA(Phe)-imidazoG37] synthetase (radical SAM superfamily)